MNFYKNFGKDNSNNNSNNNNGKDDLDSMFKGYSIQGVPRPDLIILKRDNNNSFVEMLTSNDYYINSNKKIKKINSDDKLLAFMIIKQLNGVSLATPKQKINSYFEYQDVKIPVNYAPQLKEIFDKYT